MEIKKVIPPQGNRKGTLTLRATFNPNYREWGELDKELALTLGSFWVFDVDNS